MNIKNTVQILLVRGLICLGALSILVSNYVHAEENTSASVFEYWVRVPATSLSCQEEAGVLAKRFTSATRISVKNSVCRGIIDSRVNGERLRLYSLSITYEANEKVRLYRALIGGSTEQWGSEVGVSGYSKYTECLEQIDDQTDLFVRNTRLPFVAAYCEPVHVVNATNYILNIESFGYPEAQLGSFNFDANQPSEVTDSVLFRDSVKFIQSFGVEIVRVFGRVVYFYAKPNVYFNQNKFGRFNQLEECTVQQESVLNILKIPGNVRSLVECVSLPGLKEWVLYSLSGNKRFFLSENRVTTQYYSFAECMDDRSRVLSTIQYVDHPAGAVCNEDLFIPGIYRMNVFSL